eukprot:3236359-Alexandrium_andersonii.AAC.1
MPAATAMPPAVATPVAPDQPAPVAAPPAEGAETGAELRVLGADLRAAAEASKKQLEAEGAAASKKP